jgi:hypothetical protein
MQLDGDGFDSVAFQIYQPRAASASVAARHRQLHNHQRDQLMNGQNWIEIADAAPQRG